jgi:hypothetical protein
MAFKKFQSVEKAEVVSKEDHAKIGKALRREGKKAVHELDEDERKKLANSLDNA